MKYYETWGEFPSCRIDPITVTDAPAGVRVVLAEDYDRLLEALTEIRTLASEQPDSQTHNMVIDVVDTALQEDGDE